MIAGTVSHVRTFLATAQSLASGKQTPVPSHLPLDRNGLGSVLYHAARIAERHGHADVGVIGLRGRETGAVSPIQRKFPYFGHVMLGGSGAPSLERFLEERSRTYATAFASDTEKMKGYRVMHYLPMQLLNSDRQPQSPTLSDGVGGFYEVLLNYRGRLEPDNMDWLRILGDFEVPLGAGVRIRALWWHAYEKDDLIVASAPDEDLRLSPGACGLLPVERVRVDRFGPYVAHKLKQAPSASALLPRIFRSRFRTFSLRVPSNKRILLTTMAARKTGPFRVTWSRRGLDVALDAKEFASLVVEAEQGRLNPL